MSDPQYLIRPFNDGMSNDEAIRLLELLTETSFAGSAALKSKVVRLLTMRAQCDIEANKSIRKALKASQNKLD